MTDGIIALPDSFKGWVHTVTFDNGKGFNLKVTSAKHERIAQTVGCKTYFAKPYHSWERGQNENANGLLRQYFAKKMGLVGGTAQQVLEAV